MNEAGFRAYMKCKGKSASTVENCLGFTAEFERFLRQRNPERELDNASILDLQEFLMGVKNENSHLWGIGRYYEYSGNQEMCRAATRLREEGISRKRTREKSLALKDIQGIDPEYCERLAEAGVADVKTLLQRGGTSKRRKELAESCQIPEQELLALVRLTDLTRIVDIKGKRVNLLWEAGFDSLEKIAACDPDRLRQNLITVNKRKSILRRPPTLVETTYWVQQARKLPGLVMADAGDP